MLWSAAGKPVTRHRLAVLLLLAFAPALSVPGAASATSTTRVSAEDDFFEQEVVRVPVGATVSWTNAGRNPHNEIADDGAFRSTTLGSDQSFSQTFPRPGAIPVFLLLPRLEGRHLDVRGDPGGPRGQGPRKPVRGGARPGAATLDARRTIRVPQDVPTIQGAVDRTAPDDLVLVSPGVYHEAASPSRT